jgi:hypothetical protein
MAVVVGKRDMSADMGPVVRAFLPGMDGPVIAVGHYKDRVEMDN